MTGFLGQIKTWQTNRCYHANISGHKEYQELVEIKTASLSADEILACQLSIK